ncbi:MAG: hypothetical protein M3083_08635 [Actinomycetota bacterium]|nr:hypothetical protein [Actinomycetota bacterium]
MSNVATCLTTSPSLSPRHCSVSVWLWGLVAQGATFKSTGRKVTRPGQHVIVEHRADLMAAEHAVNAEVRSCRSVALARFPST